MELLKPDGQRPRLRDLEKRCAFSRSALSRHARNCLSRRLLKEHKPQNFRRLRTVVKMPSGELLVGAGRYDGPQTITRAELHPQNDVLLRVSFECGRIGNPRALTETRPVMIGRNPIAVAEPQPKIPAPKPVALEKLGPEPPKRQQSQSYAPPEPEDSCAHSFVSVSFGIERCQYCGEQKSNRSTVIGFSFAERDALLDRVKKF